jgi:hypothetical protein
MAVSVPNPLFWTWPRPPRWDRELVGLRLGLVKSDRRAGGFPHGRVLLQAGNFLSHDAERIPAERQVQRWILRRYCTKDRLRGARRIVGLPAAQPADVAAELARRCLRILGHNRRGVLQ